MPPGLGRGSRTIPDPVPAQGPRQASNSGWCGTRHAGLGSGRDGNESAPAFGSRSTQKWPHGAIDGSFCAVGAVNAVSREVRARWVNKNIGKRGGRTWEREPQRLPLLRGEEGRDGGCERTIWAPSVSRGGRLGYGTWSGDPTPFPAP